MLWVQVVLCDSEHGGEEEEEEEEKDEEEEEEGYDEDEPAAELCFSLGGVVLDPEAAEVFGPRNFFALYQPRCFA